MMTCDEFKELAPAYALIALDEDERRACSHHLASGAPHRGCIEAVEQASLVAARLGTALAPSLPPPRVWQNIAAEVRAGLPSATLATTAAAEIAGRGAAARPLPDLRLGGRRRAAGPIPLWRFRSTCAAGNPAASAPRASPRPRNAVTAPVMLRRNFRPAALKQPARVSRRSGHAERL